MRLNFSMKRADASQYLLAGSLQFRLRFADLRFGEFDVGVVLQR
jgi:hypothetical protein